MKLKFINFFQFNACYRLFFVLIRKNNNDNKKSYYSAKLCEVRKIVRLQNCLLKKDAKICMHTYFDKMEIFRFIFHKIVSLSCFFPTVNNEC